MTIQQLKREVTELKEAAKIKQALPLDCKNLMSRYKEERARLEILCKLYDITGVAYEAPRPYRLEVENQIGLSREARKFLSLSAEKQAEAVNSYFPPKIYTEDEEEESKRKAIENINKIGGLEEFEHRLTRGCKFMKIEPLNIRLNPENSVSY